MKYLITVFLILTLGQVKGQETTLYDRNGEPVAYIDHSQRNTIYLWEGEPVAFIKRDRNDLCIYGFNKEFLGWYAKGVVYTKEGEMIGAKKGATFMITRFEGIKGIQEFAPIQPITRLPPFKPMFRKFWSRNSFEQFLLMGVEE